MTNQRLKAFVAAITLVAIAVAVGLAVYWLLFPLLSAQWQLWLAAIAGAIVVAVGLIRGLLAIMSDLPQVLFPERPPSPPAITPAARSELAALGAQYGRLPGFW